MVKKSRKKIRRPWRTAALIGVVLLGFVGLYLTAASLFRAAETTRATARLTLYHATLTEALNRYSHLPFVLAQDPILRDATEGKNLGQLNLRLAEVAARTDLEAVYVMDATGLTIAASNHDSPLTFLGRNYGFRPYFQDAMAGNSGRFFAIGVTTSRPGFFISEPVYNNAGHIAGVVAIKGDLTSLIKAWADGGETLFVSNADGVVVLSSSNTWRYGALRPISPERRAEIEAERQFLNQPLAPLDWQVEHPDQVKLDGRGYLHLTRNLNAFGWQLHFFSPTARITERALVGVGAAVAVLLLLAALALFLRSERIRRALTLSQADRRQLRQVNHALEREIEDRRAAERRLDRAQSELQRTSKLAALGQLSASVTHELGQPISAMKNYLTAAEIGATTQETRLLGRLSGLVARMETITHELRFFARPIQHKLAPVDLVTIWRNARELMQADLRHQGVALNTDMPQTPVIVHGNAQRLEQVLVNLVKNALAAMEDSADKTLHIDIAETTSTAVLRVTDTGHGLGGRAMDDLQEPFHTTRASGEGMGLGLAISSAIVKEHDGTITATDTETGAMFALTLPLSQTSGQAA